MKARREVLRRRSLLAVALAFPWGVGATARAGEVDWAGTLRQRGVALLMRHAQTAPGVGDPPGWTLERCESQRNLDDTGIAHARRIRQWFAARKLRPTSVRHSPWCRTRDTARLAFGNGNPWPALANIFEDRSGADAQAAEVRRFIETLKPGDLVVLVSHGSTIRHIVGEYTAPGEAIVVAPRLGDAAPAALDVLGRLQVP